MTKKETLGKLVWIDLEMSGLDLEKDVILEIASIITDDTLTVIEEGPSLVIHQSKEIMNNMNQWCTEHHKKSGLTDAVLASTTTIEEAEQKTLEFIQKHCPQGTGILSGNSVWQDRNFLQKYMPRITDYLHYRILDVTSIKVVARKWYPNNPHAEYKKKDTHRALDDIYESIAELQNYRKYFFQQ